MMNKVGTKVEVVVDGLMGVSKGMVGYVFEVYTDFEDGTKQGIQVIFENGEYHGFSHSEQKTMLNRVKYVPLYGIYRYSSWEEHISKVTKDYERGYWDFTL